MWTRLGGRDFGRWICCLWRDGKSGGSSYPNSSPPCLPLSSSGEARWALQSCSFTRQWKEDKALWPPLTLWPLQISAFLIHKASAGRIAGYVCNLVWITERHWNYAREKVSQVTHLQPAHISYLTVGQSTVKNTLKNVNLCLDLHFKGNIWLMSVFY